MAVLDSGVNPDNPHVSPVDGGFEVLPDGSVGDDFLDRLGHGTAVTAAVQEKAPGAAVTVVKVFHDRLATTVSALVRALDRAVDSGVRIVNLSLGTPRPEHAERLAEALARARSSNVLVVSPREHRGRSWWPGSLPGAVGVLLDRDCPRQELRVVRDPDAGLAFRASGLPRPVPGVPPERNLRGISFAVANVTGALARLLEGRPSLSRVEEMATLLER